MERPTPNFPTLEGGVTPYTLFYPSKIFETTQFYNLFDILGPPVYILNLG